MDTVDDQELETALAGHLTGWKKQDKALERVFAFNNFSTAIRFVNQVAEKAELLQHHPEITISYNKVRLTLTSHDAGGITRRDLVLAGKINEIAPAFESRRKIA
jgi:4a-hydroxytetrahydrobiopterin dehydratase